MTTERSVRPHVLCKPHVCTTREERTHAGLLKQAGCWIFSHRPQLRGFPPDLADFLATRPSAAHSPGRHVAFSTAQLEVLLRREREHFYVYIH